MNNSAVPALQMEQISKVFDKTQALNKVTLCVRKGSVHGRLGKNGAGKSTLMKIAEGVIKPTCGSVFVNGKKLSFSEPSEGRKLGLGMVFQDRSLVPHFSVTDNIFLNDELKIGPFIKSKSQVFEVHKIFEKLHVNIDPHLAVNSLSTAEQQLVEIAKALYLAKSVLILDEPTAGLADKEIQNLFQIIKNAADLNLGIVFISHYIEEIFEICDEITVLRDGRMVSTSKLKETNIDTVVRQMVGNSEFTKIEGKRSEKKKSYFGPMLKVEKLSVKQKLVDMSFELFPGEIMGVAGLRGSGRTELIESIFGALPISGGKMEYKKAVFIPKCPSDAIQKGIYLIPKNRQKDGLILDHSIESNIVLSILNKLQHAGFIYHFSKSKKIANKYAKMLDVKLNNISQPVKSLSGGNQQKIMIAKAFSTKCDLLLLNEPTFGVDIKTTFDIKNFIREHVKNGGGALWVSSDFRELIDVSDRILILIDGKIKNIITNKSKLVTEEELLRAVQPRKNDYVIQ